ncbi:MAG TPA: KTSC domain-containing protein [Quisquiliibacterium sp.]|nr:KTSC domain-containing protein [Quisquiliibacterium sp.]HQP67432.1 KTSC domain-containing protein [Quisquiliibacterium sp.]
MEQRPLRGGTLRAGAYDAREQRLELTFTDHSVRVFKGVPHEVWQRLLSAPNPGAYFDDRIADEYPSQRGSPRASAAARAKLDDLFGGPAAGED